MSKRIMNSIKGIFISVLLLFPILLTFAQDDISEKDKIVFVILEKREKNFIVIPNFGQLHSFKIYRKLKNDTSYTFMAEKIKPPLPLRNNNLSPYGVNWEDPDFHSRDVDYKVLAFSKNGKQLCEMQIIWEKEKGKTNEVKIEKE